MSAANTTRHGTFIFARRTQFPVFGFFKLLLQIRRRHPRNNGSPWQGGVRFFFTEKFFNKAGISFKHVKPCVPVDKFLPGIKPAPGKKGFFGQIAGMFVPPA
jgi:hypothetical protein